MFDAKQAYMNALEGLSDFIASKEKNEAILQAYSSLLSVLSNDPYFRAKTYIELSQVKEDD